MRFALTAPATSWETRFRALPHQGRAGKDPQQPLLSTVISYQLSVISYQGSAVSVISYQLSVISYQLPVTSYQLPVTS
ncbi:hypothetical protein, partial [Brasilonema sp. UFV-L1]|uniref:hypothetical protein n=1 Tax=Brasilonema sp. UFV-L1 TaxID=2234130 RepID=UPI001B7D11AF